MSSPATPSGRTSSDSPDRSSSGDWLARVRDGDSAALAAFFGRYRPWLRRWASGRLPRWARSIADTSDLVQDVVGRTLPLIGTLNLRGRRALAAYLRQAVENRIRDEHRRIARRGPPVAIDFDAAESGPSPLDELLSREKETQYRAALASLSAGDRELIVGHIELGYSHAQLGIMTHRSANAARVALQRAIRRLVDRMRYD